VKAVVPGSVTLLRLNICLALLLHVCVVHATEVEATQPRLSKPPKPKIAIIIDDLGYKLREGKRSINLAYPLTLAIIPSSPHAKVFAEAANCHEGKEILVHLPMTPDRSIAWEAGLNQDMDEQEFTQTTEYLLSKVPFAIGVNNHVGSKLTQDRERMDWLMAVLERKQLFFVDSRTTPASVAGEAAASAYIPFAARDIFLDNIRDPDAINKQLDLLVAVALKQGQAIAIGHPHKETLSVLEKRLEEIQQQGFELVGISELLQQNRHLASTDSRKNAASAL